MLGISTDIDNKDYPYRLLFREGDFLISDTTEQEMRLVLSSTKGNWKQHPLLGAELYRAIHLPYRTNLKSKISKELEKIGLKLTKFNVNTNTDEIDIEVE